MLQERHQAGKTMNRPAAWRWIPALRVWRCTVLSCVVLLLGMVCAAEAGINVWTRGEPPILYDPVTQLRASKT